MNGGISASFAFLRSISIKAYIQTGAERCIALFGAGGVFFRAVVSTTLTIQLGTSSYYEDSVSEHSVLFLLIEERTSHILQT